MLTDIGAIAIGIQNIFADWAYLLTKNLFKNLYPLKVNAKQKTLFSLH